MPFEPRNEFGTRDIWAVAAAKMGWEIVESRAPFPDYIMQDADGNTVRTEVEYLSANALFHGHDLTGCDVVVCWIHDSRLPVKVLELKTGVWHEPVPWSEVRALPRPGKPKPRTDAHDLAEWLYATGGYDAIIILRFYSDYIDDVVNKAVGATDRFNARCVAWLHEVENVKRIVAADVSPAVKVSPQLANDALGLLIKRWTKEAA